MSETTHLTSFIDAFKMHLEKETFVKISLGNYKGTEEALKQILIRKVLIKQVYKLAFTFRYKTRDVVKNLEVAQGIEGVENYLLSGFCIATLFTTDGNFIYEKLNSGKTVFRSTAATVQERPSVNHDKDKNRLIHSADKAYLTELKITDATGKVFKNAQDKFRQINHYIEIISSLIKEFPAGTIKKAADMGSGKGYLTFALYDYLHYVLGEKTAVTGVEYRKDMVDLCNEVALKSSFNQLNFVEGTIEAYLADGVNLLIALHACDTATDDAIFKGLQANAELIVVAPCCHKQIRQQIEYGKVKNEVSFLTRYGVFLERQAEMVTDGIRALILEYFGYKTKVFEFVSDAHTPKNVLVVGIRGKAPSDEAKTTILQKIKDSKAYFGIRYHHLERLLGL